MRNQLTILFAFIFIACNAQKSKETEFIETDIDSTVERIIEILKTE